MIKDYRESHTAIGKGDVYHNSFSIFNYRAYIWHWEKKVMDQIFEKFSKSDKQILDFACGTGRILTYLDTKSKDVTGVDISDSMLKVSTGNLPHMNIRKMDLTKNNLLLKEKKSFDVITAFRFFLNAQDELRLEVLDALYPLLKNDGIFILNNHGNATGIGVILGKIIVGVKNWFRKEEDKFVFKLLTERHLLKILDTKGFEVVDIYHRNVIPVMNEKTKFDLSNWEKWEDWFSSKLFLRHFSRNVLYVCRKKKK